MSFLFIFFYPHQNNRNYIKIKISKLNDKTSSLNFSAVGDIMCHSSQFNSARIGKIDSFDFRGVFSEIKPFLRKSDFTMGNLETTISSKNQNLSGYPIFNSPTELLHSLKYSGFDILFTANNHAYDNGFKGIENTINAIKRNGMIHAGTFLSKRDKESIITIKRNGFKFVILAYTYGLNGKKSFKNKQYGVKFIEKKLIASELADAAELKPDFIIVYFHFGNEYQPIPSKYQKDIVAFTIENGADIILGSHTHVLQPIEKFKSRSGRLDSGFVAYSLGNFISNQRWRYADGGGVLNFIIKKNILKDSIFVSSLNFLPTWVFKGKIDNKIQFKVLPIFSSNNLPPYLSDIDKVKMDQAFNDARDIITSTSNMTKLFGQNK